jgi:uncharacterized protein with PIN domain
VTYFLSEEEFVEPSNDCSNCGRPLHEDEKEEVQEREKSQETRLHL